MGWYGLSDSEHEIMKYIWKHEEVTLREVVAWLENRGYTWKQRDGLYASEPPDR